jgi:adenylate kinase family enzyme
LKLNTSTYKFWIGIAPEINKAEYTCLTKEILIKMIQLRLSEEDCNAGVIFDNLVGEYWENEHAIISIISEAIPIQNL